MKTKREVLLWPSRENYARFAAVCDDAVPETFDKFEAMALPRLRSIEREYGIAIAKIDFDPDRMALWCRENFGKVDSNARKFYAAFISLAD